MGANLKKMETITENKKNTTQKKKDPATTRSTYKEQTRNKLKVGVDLQTPNITEKKQQKALLGEQK